MTSPAPSVSAPTAIGVRAFLAALRSAELFAPMQLTRVEAAVPPDAATPADAARALVAAGFLTQFQAERLLAGKTDGYHLGPYVILEQVGRGTVGRVFKARHRTMNRPVAVKVVAAELTRTAAERRAFQAEVRAAAQLNHPNIVTAYDANELAGASTSCWSSWTARTSKCSSRSAARCPWRRRANSCAGRRRAGTRTNAGWRGDIKPTNLLVAAVENDPGPAGEDRGLWRREVVARPRRSVRRA